MNEFSIKFLYFLYITENQFINFIYWSYKGEKHLLDQTNELLLTIKKIL